MLTRLSKQGELFLDSSQERVANSLELTQEELVGRLGRTDTESARKILALLLRSQRFEAYYRQNTDSTTGTLTKRVLIKEAKRVFKAGLVTAIEAATLKRFATAAVKLREERQQAFIERVEDYQDQFKALMGDDEVRGTTKTNLRL